jgi:hypothetical protein
MSAILTASLNAFRENLRLHGERLALPWGAVVLGLVRRDVVGAARRAGVPDFSTRASVSIEIEKPVEPITVGKYLTPAGSNAERFRVAEILAETGYSLRLLCESSNPQAVT